MIAWVRAYEDRDADLGELTRNLEFQFLALEDEDLPDALKTVWWQQLFPTLEITSATKGPAWSRRVLSEDVPRILAFLSSLRRAQDSTPDAGEL